ncbi:inositol monophosphatase [Alphaproteobacteria bacterium]|nr:inositol monophosphatase [Alphaproteobacteria bacterium]
MVGRNLHHQFTSPVINVMYRAISAVTVRVLRDFGEVEDLQTSLKGPGNFVSITDKQVEATIRDELQRARPDYGFIGEESGAVAGNDSPYTWVLDPIDGTNNFVHGYPHFCISLALVKDGVPIAGMIHDPLRDELFFAYRGEGVYEQRQRLRVSKRHDFVTALGATTGPLRGGEQDGMKRFTAAMVHIPCVRQTGSAALDLAYVAAGRLDVFWSEKLAPWDCLAGILMVQEAGGYATDFKNKKITLATENIKVLAGNPEIHGKMLDVFKDALS